MTKMERLNVDRVSGIGGTNTNVVTQHDLDIPEGYVAEIWGCAVSCNGFLDTGGVSEMACSLDDAIITLTAARTSDDVIRVFQFETLLVTTGAAMVKGSDSQFFPFPFVTAQDKVNWITFSVTDWTACTFTYALYYKLRKATPADIADLLLRRR